MKKQKQTQSELSDRHIAWIVYHKMAMRVKPSKKLYKRAATKQSRED